MKTTARFGLALASAASAQNILLVGASGVASHGVAHLPHQGPGVPDFGSGTPRPQASTR